MSNLTGEEWISGDNHIIMGGGESLPGAPESWKAAHSWAESANADKDEGGPLWRWDCHFKLDYDGPLLQILSRFYPPAKYHGPKWGGTCYLRFGEETITTQGFTCGSLDELKKQVEAYVEHLQEQAKQRLRGIS